MSNSISTLLIRNLRDVFGENDPERRRAAIDELYIVPHTATAKAVFDSKALARGRSWSYVANKTGTHPYICSYHPTMKGELVVK